MNISKWDYFNTIVEENERRKKLFNHNYILFEGKNPGYTSENIFNILKGKLWGNDYVTFNEKYIRFLFTMTDYSKKDMLKNKIEDYFKEVEFYEI